MSLFGDAKYYNVSSNSSSASSDSSSSISNRRIIKKPRIRKPKFKSGDKVKFNEYFKKNYIDILEDNEETQKMVENEWDSILEIHEYEDWHKHGDNLWYIIMYNGQKEWFMETELERYIEFELEEELFLV